MAGILVPDQGRIRTQGKVSALLELGAGFHPELSGRDNVYLNGSILGLSRKQIDRQFDEIVDFAGLETFIDTPVKNYSSGMYVRLGFSVAINVDPDILLVDEVLAVGDADFQRRCLDKMEQVGAQGRTVVFVSHDMSAVTRLCTRALLLEKGRVVADGRAAEVVHRYLHGGSFHGAAVREWPTRDEAPGDDVARLSAVRVLDARGAPAPEIDIRRPVRIQVDFWNLRPEAQAAVNVHLYNEEGVCIFVSSDFTTERWRAGPREAGLVRSTCEIPGNFLSEGLVTVHAAVSSYRRVTVHALERDAVAFTVVDPSTGDGARGPYAGPMAGVVRPMLEWKLQRVEPETER
jgi:lipopolysaccharide transport system ATP-binding protein